MKYFIPDKDSLYFESVLEKEGVTGDTEATLKRT